MSKHFSMSRETMIKGYPQNMRIQRQSNGICLVHFLTFRSPCRTDMVYCCPQSFSKPSKYSIECRNQKSSFKSSKYFKVWVVCQSHLFWITLYLSTNKYISSFQHFIQGVPKTWKFSNEFNIVFVLN